MIFWALEQRSKWREERLAARAARDAALRAEIDAEVVRDMEARLVEWAKGRGISPEDLPRLS